MFGCYESDVEADTRSTTERAGNMLHWAMLLPVAVGFGFKAGRDEHQAQTTQTARHVPGRLA